MKYIYLLFAISIFAHCKSEQVLSNSDIQIDGSYLSAEGARKYLPSKYQNNSTILYKSKSGEEKTIKTVFATQTSNAQWSGQTYQRDQIIVTFSEPTDPNFTVFISGTSDYFGKNEIVQSVSVTIMPGTQYWTIGTIYVNSKGEFQKTPIDQFSEELVLEGKTFWECFRFTGTKTDAYSEFYLNSNNGLVAFRDKTDKLFVFEKFVQ